MVRISSNRHVLAGITLTLLCGLSTGTARAQVDSYVDQLLGTQTTDANPSTSITRLRNQSPFEMPPLEGAVDEQTYVVGPGDLFNISVGGPRPLMLMVPVSADGYLGLPEAGSVNVAGLSLLEARNVARRALHGSFQDVRVNVSLAQPRRFYVHVSGAVHTPGRYLATPVARVSSVLAMAYVDTTLGLSGNPALRPALRNVTLTHRDGTEDTVDLLRYLSTGDTTENPYLRDGDVISVPSYDPAYEAVFVSGNVAFPGTYDHRTDDTIHDLLVLALGQASPDSTKRIRLTRIDDDGTIHDELYDRVSPENPIPVRARDQVHVLLEETVRGSATIDGWVVYPGTYPILPGETTAQDLMEIAGGLRPGALVRAATLERAMPLPPEIDLNADNPFFHAFVQPPTTPMDTLAVLQATRLGSMEFASRIYLADELMLSTRMPIDLEGARDGHEQAPVYLENGDRIYVPRDRNSVFVLGQVGRPGYVAYTPEAPLSHYITVAGGLSRNAGKTWLIQAGTGRHLDPRKTLIRSGDRIFVDRRVGISDNPEIQRLLVDERRLRIQGRATALQTIAVSASVVSSIILYLTLRSN